MLRDAHASVLGTPDYQKYLMQNEWKRKRQDGTWTPYRFIGWYIPYEHDGAKIKKVGDRVFIMTYEGDYSVERYEVTPEVNELLNIY